jgi:hypothetical protein
VDLLIVTTVGFECAVIPRPPEMAMTGPGFAHVDLLAGGGVQPAVDYDPLLAMMPHETR